MRIGIVSVSDGRLGDGLRIKKFKQYLREMGHEVVVLNPFGCVRNLLGMKGASRPMSSAVRFWSKISEIPIVRSGPVQIGMYKTITKLLSRQLLRMVRREKVDLLQAETQAAGELTFQIKREVEIPIFLDVHSGSYVDEVNQQIHPPPEFLDYVRNREAEAVLNSDEVFVVSDDMKRLINSSFSSVSVTLVPNGADVHPGLTKEYGNPLRVAYSGNFSYWERLEDYFHAVQLLNGGGYEYYLLGDGVMRKRILAMIAQIAPSKHPIRYLGYLPRQEYVDFMSQMHIGVAPNANEKSRLYCCPIKLFEYMSFGLPVVCAHLGQWPQLLKEHNCGIVVPPEDPKAIAEGIQSYEDEELWWKHSQNGVKVIENKYSWEKIIKGLDSIYRKYEG